MMTRSRHPSSSDQNESDNGSNSTCLSQHSSQHRRGTGHKPSEVFRTDLITAMKIPDSCTLSPDDFYVLTDPWKQEWEKGVQVPVNPHVIPQPGVRVLEEKRKAGTFVLPKKLVRASGSEAPGYPDMNALAERTCRYDLDDEDVAWLAQANQQFSRMALPLLDETRMELVLEDFERRCHENMAVAVETQEGLGIEFDEDVVCDVCRSPDGEDGNEMVFCDKCNICVHQACYGIQKVPTGSWLCRICALGILPKCELCPKNGGAMKPTRSGTKWIHVSCALWIPEVSIGNPEKMEPIINVSRIPSSRWALTCCICKEKSGACIQCSVKKCRTAFHVTCSHHAGLEMNTTLTEDDEVKFKVFCPRHSGLEGEEDAADSTGNDQNAAKTPKRSSKEESVAEAEKRVSLRKLKLQEMENEFYKFVDPAKVAAHLKVSRETVDFVFQYWKLKRKTNFNRPLLIPKKDEEENLARREQELLRKRLQLFTHLRQDLERVRNLTYMVTRREKMKRSMWRIQEQIFQHQVRLLDHKLISGDPSSKDLEQLLSLGLVWSQSSLNHSSSSSSSTSRKSKHHKKKKRRKSREHRDPTRSSPSRNPFLQTDESQTQRNITCDAQSELQNEEIQPREVQQFDQEVAVKVESKRREDGEVLRHKRNHKKQEKSKISTQNGFKEKQLSIHLVDIRHKDSDSYLMYGQWEANDAKARLKANPTVPNGLSKKHQANGAANGRSWGKFRIPKRKFENEDLNKQQKAMLKPLTNSKQTLDTDTDLKRCNRNEAMLTRRYDFIHRGVLAS